MTKPNTIQSQPSVVHEALSRFKTLMSTDPHDFRIVFLAPDMFELHMQALRMDEPDYLLDATAMRGPVSQSDRYKQLMYVFDKKHPEWLRTLPKPLNKAPFTDLFGRTAVRLRVSSLNMREVNTDVLADTRIKSHGHAHVLFVEVTQDDFEPRKKKPTKHQNKIRALIKQHADARVQYERSRFGVFDATISKDEHILSRSGMEDTLANLQEAFVRLAVSQLDGAPLTPVHDRKITENSPNAEVDYQLALMLGQAEYKADFNYVGNLYQQLQFAAVRSRCAADFAELIHLTVLKRQIGETRIKDLVAHALTQEDDELNISTILESGLPDNLIVNNKTPDFGLTPVQLAPLKFSK